MQTQQPQDRQVPADMKLSVTLEAQQWAGVMTALHEMPFRLAAPLIQAITDQIQTQAGAPPPVEPVRSNGLDTQPAGDA